ncbi:MAG: sugar transferase [Clostridia bacterium]|nr:sugar transferase [Clostridia bacterium]
MYRIKSNLQNIIIIFIDCITILLSLMLSNYIRNQSWLLFNDSANDILSLMALFIICYLTTYLVINFNQNYLQKGPLHELFDIIKMHAVIYAFAFVLIYFTRIISDFSRLAFIYFFLIDTLAMLLFHTLLKYLIKTYYIQSASLRQLVIVASSDTAEELVENIQHSNDWGYHVVAVVLADVDRTGETLKDVPIVADLDSLVSYCQTAPIDEVLFSLTADYNAGLGSMLKEISSMGIVVHVNVDFFFEDITSQKVLTHIGDKYVITYANRFLSMRQMLAKRTLDIIGSLLGVILLIPVTLVLAPIIKIESPGPVFFAQKRVGKNGRIFKMYKFRSMYIDAEERKADLMNQNEMDGLMFKLDNDPRVTKTGKFIRRTSLDELPQFLNILKGDMSLVGTRPPTIDEFEQYQSYHKKRLATTPGLTGLWQVSGRNEINDFEEVVRLDVNYIDNWSLGLDLKILWKTVGVVFNRKGAK